MSVMLEECEKGSCGHVDGIGFELRCHRHVDNPLAHVGVFGETG
jgi:hypothetical protein